MIKWEDYSGIVIPVATESNTLYEILYQSAPEVVKISSDTERRFLDVNKLRFRIQEAPGSNLGLETDLPSYPWIILSFVATELQTASLNKQQN